MCSLLQPEITADLMETSDGSGCSAELFCRHFTDLMEVQTEVITSAIVGTISAG